MRGYEPGIFCLDNSIVDDYLAELLDTEVRVLLSIARHADRAGQCFPGAKLICQETARGKRTVELAIESLAKRGLIRIIPRCRGSGRRWVGYQLLTPPAAAARRGEGNEPIAQPAAPKKAQPAAPFSTGEGASQAQPAAREGAAGCAIPVKEVLEGGKGGPPLPEAQPRNQPLQPPGGPARRRGPLSAESIAEDFAEMQTRRPGGLPADAASAIEADVRELVRRGLSVAELRGLLCAKGRDRYEYWSAFRQRCADLLKRRQQQAERRREPIEAPATICDPVTQILAGVLSGRLPRSAAGDLVQ